MMVRENDLATVQEFIDDMVDAIESSALRLGIPQAAAMIYLLDDLLREADRADSALAADYANQALILCGYKDKGGTANPGFDADAEALGKTADALAQKLEAMFDRDEDSLGNLLVLGARLQ